MESPRALLAIRSAVAVVAAALQVSCFLLSVRTLRESPDDAYPASVVAAVALAFSYALTASQCRETGRFLRPALIGAVNPFSFALAIVNLRAERLVVISWAYLASIALAAASVPIVPRIVRAETEEKNKEKMGPVLAV